MHLKKSIFFLCLISVMSSCLEDKFDPDVSNFPPEVSKILITKCAVSGCHNTDAIGLGIASGLDLSSWDKMFNGSVNGASVIPYSTYYSTLLYFTNTDSLEGIVAVPTMPLNDTPLSKAEYYTLRDWIAKGAPDKNGKIKFSDNPQRKKFYVSNQGCDNIEVFDSERKVAMRVLNVGTIPGSLPVEAPHMIRVTPDNKYLVVIFAGYHQGYMQVYRTTDDSLVKNITIGGGGWNTFAISSNSKFAYVADFNGGRLVYVDLENGVMTEEHDFNTSLHGTALNNNM
jgi:DNA-binding beta-propeller fold protein YncE